MGNIPDPNAKRRNLDGQFSIVEWTELVEGDDVPPMPEGFWGASACQMWDDLWRGPLRAELLPQHRQMMWTLLTIVEKLSDPDISLSLFDKMVSQLLRFSALFGLDPGSVRKMRVAIKPGQAAVKPADAKQSEDDELAKRRAMQERMAGGA